MVDFGKHFEKAMELAGIRAIIGSIIGHGQASFNSQMVTLCRQSPKNMGSQLGAINVKQPVFLVAGHPLIQQQLEYVIFGTKISLASARPPPFQATICAGGVLLPAVTKRPMFCHDPATFEEHSEEYRRVAIK